eukprot:1222386-Amphidinium_carterae.1
MLEKAQPEAIVLYETGAYRRRAAVEAENVRKTSGLPSVLGTFAYSDKCEIRTPIKGNAVQ